jgi:hypothetical protein
VEGWWGVNDYDGLEYVKELRDRIAELAALAMEWEQELEEPLDNSERRRLHPHYIHGYDCALRRCVKELRDAVLSEPAAEAAGCEASGCSCDTCLPKACVFDGKLMHLDSLFAEAIKLRALLTEERAEHRRQVDEWTSRCEALEHELAEAREQARGFEEMRDDWREAAKAFEAEAQGLIANIRHLSIVWGNAVDYGDDPINVVRREYSNALDAVLEAAGYKCTGSL